MKIEHKRRAETLSNRLRTSCRRGDQSGDADHFAVSNKSITLIADKLDAVGEALAYLVDKRWAKEKAKKVSKQLRKSKRGS